MVKIATNPIIMPVSIMFGSESLGVTADASVVAFVRKDKCKVDDPVFLLLPSEWE
jgi:hypothetical protein